MVQSQEDAVLRVIAETVDLPSKDVRRVLDELGFSGAVAAANAAGVDFAAEHLTVVIRPASGVFLM